MTDLTQKPCQCGGIAKQVITHISQDGKMLDRPQRRGWYCSDCKSWEKAILREMRVEDGEQ